ncbi:MAG TPA: hypothetical protein VNE67_02445 [Acetobacteraceae bacterium]|nr:hypothetical protein [Acetobacteraceae bacterium]
MPRRYYAFLVLPAALALGGCVTTNEPAQPRSATVIMTQPAQPQATTVAPAAPPPPPPQAALVPPPPQGSGSVVWQPGHWTYTGSPNQPWSWVDGRYVSPPNTQQATWIPGQWVQDTSGSWMWNAGHWQ